MKRVERAIRIAAMAELEQTLVFEKLSGRRVHVEVQDGPDSFSHWVLRKKDDRSEDRWIVESQNGVASRSVQHNKINRYSTEPGW